MKWQLKYYKKKKANNKNTNSFKTLLIILKKTKTVKVIIPVHNNLQKLKRNNK
jgi:hypothetical protein